MSKITYPLTSPYALSKQNDWYMGAYSHRRIGPAGDDISVLLETRHQYRPDVLSQELYGTPALWWVFTVRNMNKLRDPLNDFTTGKQIFAPSMASLKKALGI